MSCRSLTCKACASGDTVILARYLAIWERTFTIAEERQWNLIEENAMFPLEDDLGHS